MNLPPTLRQLALLARETISFRRLLVNRFVAILVALALLSIGATAYMDANDGGTVTGVVVDADGTPIPDVNVTLRSQTFEGVPDVKRTTTDGDGEFTFESYRADGEQALEFRLSAAKTGVGTSGPCHLHVYFPDQSVSVRLSLDGRPCKSSV